MINLRASYRRCCRFRFFIVWVTGVIEIVLGVMILCPHFRARVGVIFGALFARRAAREYLHGDGRDTVRGHRNQPRRALDKGRPAIPAYCVDMVGDAAC